MAVRSVSHIIKGMPTLEGEVFWSIVHFIPTHCPISIHFCCSTRWGPCRSGREKPKVLQITRTVDLKPSPTCCPEAFVTRTPMGRRKTGSRRRSMDDSGPRVVHSEEPSEEFQQTDGTLHNVQL